ncbi:MAG: hypothetical protein ACRDIE_05010 [Chloroflexota bacterium]
MATEHVREQDNSPHRAKSGIADNERPHEQAKRTYRLGPEDLEEFVALGADGRHRLVEIPGALEAWLTDHAAKYA